MRARTILIRGSLVTVISLLAILLAAPPNAKAQSRADDGQEQVKVVGHLALQGIHVNQMFTQNRNGKHYLYLHRPAKQAFALVDVSRMDKPVLVERAALTEAPQVRVDVDPTSPMLAVAVAPERPAKAKVVEAKSQANASDVVLPTETVRLIDLSDPTHPKTLKTFTGVTSMLPDESRKLIYIVNDEGLWIVRHRQTRPMPMCSSEDALVQLPDCQ
jgi:hypothetical protein